MGYIYALLLLTSALVSIRSRQSDAQILATTMWAGSFATWALMFARGHRWDHFNLAILLIDLAMLAAFAWVAFRSNMRWPMLVCAFQFIGAASHLAGTIADTPATRIIGVVQGIWAYLQCFAIIFGVTLNSRRTISDPKSMRIS
jgi:hypothetical protein